MAAPDRQTWVQSLLPLAQQWEAKTGIPASYWLAINASESNWGNAGGNELFGIKAPGNAGSLNSPTWESVNGQRVNQNADFGTYKTANDAYQAFWDLVSTSPRYAGAMQQLRQGNPQGFLQGINAAGYATDPQWANKIQSIASTTIQPMIGSKMMGQQQEGIPPPPDSRPALPGQMSPGPATDPNLTIDQSLVDAAINGDTPGAATPGYVPDGSVGTVDNNKPATDPTTNPQGMMNGNDIRDLIAEKLGPWVSQVVINPTTTTHDALGTLTSPNRQPTYRYTWANGKTLDIAALDTGAVVKGGTALAVLASGTKPEVQTFPDGSLRQYDPDSKTWTVIGAPPANKADPAPKTVNTKSGTYQYDNGTWTLIPGTEPPGARAQIHQMPDGSLQQYDPDTGQWTLIQPRYVDPAEAAYKQAQTANLQANTAKTQQSLRPVAQAAVEDAYATIAAIQQQVASGQTSPKEADALMKQVHDGLAATLAGTTLFEQQKQAQDTQTQRANTASNFLQQRIQSAASLGASLFGAATANGGILLPKGGGSWGIDPLAIANQEVNTMGGGQQTGDAAAAFLRAALSGGAPDAGGPAPGPGGAAPSPFPTTREAVLAAYPHLAGPTTQNAQVIPPNNAGGGAVPLTVAPPTPMPLPLSPRNQQIQAGG